MHKADAMGFTVKMVNILSLEFDKYLCNLMLIFSDFINLLKLFLVNPQEK